MTQKNYQSDFHDFGDVIWLNAASEGPLPVVAREALNQAVEWKSSVYELDIPKFIQVPLELKRSIGRLIHVDPKDVILGTSASYGLHLLADGIDWQQGDEIVLMQNDFPTNIIPWLALEKKGVVVKQIPASSHILNPEEFCSAVTPRTRLTCLSHVHTFSGHMLNIDAISKVCRSQGIVCVLNIAQSVGTMPVDVAALNVDAIVAVGYKWLCGPYGTGFCWMRPELRKSLQVNRAYWPNYMTAEEMKETGPIVFKEQTSAQKYDVFGTANFFNFVPLRAAIDYWLEVGIENVYTHNQSLIDQFLNGLDRHRFGVISPEDPEFRSGLLVITCADSAHNENLYKHLQSSDIYSAFWKGNIRLTPHVYNTPEQVEKTLQVLHAFNP